MNGQELLTALIERLRSHRGSYKEIAAAGGVSYSTLNQIVNGHRDNPTIELVDQLNRAVDIFERGQAA